MRPGCARLPLRQSAGFRGGSWEPEVGTLPTRAQAVEKLAHRAKEAVEMDLHAGGGVRAAESRSGSFRAESRPHRDWLGEGWYRDLSVCLDAAKRHDLPT